MEIVKTALTAVLSLVVLFISAKLMGHRQISQLDSFDYINGITIGSIAAELATDIEEPMKPFVALIVYLIFTIAINIATNKSSALRKFFNGSPTIIMENGKLYKNNLKKEKLDLGEFLMMCRQAGFFDISQIQTAVFEDNGRLTILPTSDSRPVTPADIGISPTKASVFAEVIMDGKVMIENLREAGRDLNWLNEQLEEQGYSDVSEIFLGLYCEDGSLSLYPIGVLD